MAADSLSENSLQSPTKEINYDDDESVNKDLSDLSNFKISRILNCDSSSKRAVVLGCFENKKGDCILSLEKTVFEESDLKKICTKETTLQQEFRNDIYANYICFPRAEVSALRALVIHPATEKHIKKYELQVIHIINETPELYNTVTLPYLEKEQFSLQWVYNILELKAEVERTVLNDEDPDTGFTLATDPKWDGIDLQSLYLLAIVRQRGLKSLRDLNSSHLPLLRNILKKGTEEIEKRYNLPQSRLRIFFHYQPSFYHLHIHFTQVQHDAPGIYAGRAHLLESVINNIELIPDYYQRAVLPFSVGESDRLFKCYSDKGVKTN